MRARSSLGVRRISYCKRRTRAGPGNEARFTVRAVYNLWLEREKLVSCQKGAFIREEAFTVSVSHPPLLWVFAGHYYIDLVLCMRRYC